MTIGHAEPTPYNTTWKVNEGLLGFDYFAAHDGGHVGGDYGVPNFEAERAKKGHPWVRFERRKNRHVVAAWTRQQVSEFGQTEEWAKDWLAEYDTTTEE